MQEHIYGYNKCQRCFLSARNKHVQKHSSSLKPHTGSLSVHFELLKTEVDLTVCQSSVLYWICQVLHDWLRACSVPYLTKISHAQVQVTISFQKKTPLKKKNKKVKIGMGIS